MKKEPVLDQCCGGGSIPTASSPPSPFSFPPTLLAASGRALARALARFSEIDAVTEYNQQKVLAAFITHNVSETHFAASTGYGYGDRGRETLESVFAQCVGAQAALVRHTFTCGTHTLAVALFGILRPGDTMLCVTGTPYDTIHSVIGLRGEGKGSLRDFGVTYHQTELTPEGRLDLPAIRQAVRELRPRVVYLQRSRGYTLRPSLSVEAIGELAALVREARKTQDIVLLVDNCYGEFVQTAEPCQCGADLIAGSLIKNPGGGLAQNGGYIAGRKDLVELCAYRLTAPGIGGEVGATLGLNRSLFLGLFQAPHIVGEALKTAVFTAALCEELGFEVAPGSLDPRYDIIQAVRLGSPEALTAFCQGLQSGAPVDAFLTPEPWDMPGYDSQVIMAAGTFTMGASIELSADAPLREPYAVWLQGGLNFHSAKAAVLLAAKQLMDRGLLNNL
ncbi:MAG: methionine gamma-lyase family protein [Oscillospiraceae bacterium]|jgi:cystathionine beta-lyase family protein involved in aluminum resistance|nr:methionine gamma-lyase family protein [Oscillospiraceae bacterium]